MKLKVNADKRPKAEEEMMSIGKDNKVINLPRRHIKMAIEDAFSIDMPFWETIKNISALVTPILVIITLIVQVVY